MKNKIRGITAGQIRKAVAILVSDLSVKPRDEAIRKVLATITPIEVEKAVFTEVRRVLTIEVEKITNALVAKLGEKYDFKPQPRDLMNDLDALGYKYPRQYIARLGDCMHAQFADRWAENAESDKRKKLRLSEGEQALWDALESTYNLEASALASMLLRIFTVMTHTGKLDHMQVLYLASSVSERGLKRYAKSMTFRVSSRSRYRV